MSADLAVVVAGFLVLAGLEVVVEGQDGKMSQQRTSYRIRLSLLGR